MTASLETDNQHLIGRKVECTAEHGAFAPCKWCGSIEGQLHEGTATHALGIECVGCGRRGRWLTRIAAEQLRENSKPIEKLPIPEPYAHTVDAIYRVYEAKAKRDQREREYLGLSAMASDCDRAIWYAFRWATPPEGFDGRKLRLFETGHREEVRLIRDLRAAGMTVQDHDPDTGAQWAFAAVGGHVRGHLDGKVVGVMEAPSTVHVLECKTHNAKSFKALLKDGVRKSKPGHWRQMLGYMHLSGLTRAFYIAQCKDDDEIHVERVEYNVDEAARLFGRAERIVFSPEPPPKLYDDPKAKMAFACGYCPARGQCHDGLFARVNCRTCLHSTPVDGGWRCDRHGIDLDIKTQRVGCPHHLFIPGLVPGEQVDSDEKTETVTYTMADGSRWVDGRDRCSA